MRMQVSTRDLLRACTAVAMSMLAIWATGMHTMALAATQTPALPVTASQLGTVRGLVPGGAARGIDYTITNPNPTPVYVAAVKISMTGATYVAAAGTGKGTTGANHPAGGAAPGCTAANFVVGAPDALNQHLPPGETSFTRLTTKKSGTLTMIESGVNQDNCKGVMVTLAISVA